MLFSADAVAGLADGTITVTFRTWKAAQVKVGGTYRKGELALLVDAVGQVRAGDITDVAAVAAGEADREALLRRLGGPAPDDEVWRVDFHRVDAPDPRAELAGQATLDDGTVAEITGRLDRLDRAASDGAWTRATLAAIAERPGVVSTTLAEQLGRERAAFKLDVRKLKALGLTESLEVGYRLSPRGAAFMAATGGPRRARRASVPSSSHGW